MDCFLQDLTDRTAGRGLEEQVFTSTHVLSGSLAEVWAETAGLSREEKWSSGATELSLGPRVRDGVPDTFKDFLCGSSRRLLQLSSSVSQEFTVTTWLPTTTPHPDRRNIDLLMIQ